MYSTARPGVRFEFRASSRTSDEGGRETIAGVDKLSIKPVLKGASFVDFSE